VIGRFVHNRSVDPPPMREGDIVFKLFKRRSARQPDLSPAEPSLTTADIFSQYAPFAWRVLRRLGVAEADVDDVCQEVFVTVHRRLADFEGRSSVRTWVYGICIKTASDYRKRVKTRREVVQEANPELAVAPGQEDDLSLRQARGVLDRILDRLGDDKRAVFVLYEIEELPMAEICSILGCPLQTAYSRLHAARGEVERAVALLRTRDEARTP
jgi:RNA polymerase sigma-70 factor (ECF subfamily)